MKTLTITLLTAFTTLTFAQDFNAAQTLMIEYEPFYFLEQPCPDSVSDALRAARCGLTETIDPVTFQEQFNEGWQQNTTDYSVVLPWQFEGSTVLAVFPQPRERKGLLLHFQWRLYGNRQPTVTKPYCSMKLPFHPRELIWVSVLLFAVYVFRWQIFLVLLVWIAGVMLFRWAIGVIGYFESD